MLRYGSLCVCVAGLVLGATAPAPAFDIGGSMGFALENGDVNGDLTLDLSDPVFLLSHLYLGGPAPVPLALCGTELAAVRNGDANGDGTLDVSDPVHLLAGLFTGGPAPLGACGDGGGGAGKSVPRLAPPGSKAFGKSLAEWLETYWRAAIGGGPTMVGRVELLAIPAGEYLGGSGSFDDPAHLKGEIDIDQAPGTPFVLPLFAWVAERYAPELGYPDDPCVDDAYLLAGVTPLTLTIDGVVVISDANEGDFYVPCTSLDPPIMYDGPTDYGSIAAIAFQGVGFVSPPLSVGDHEIKLYEEYIIEDFQGFTFGVIYDNTWRIHVKP